MDFLYKESECGRTLLEWLERMNDEIVDRLVAYREELNKTQQDIANATGLSVAEIERIEKKEEKPPLWKLQKYAESLGLDINFDIAKTEEREGKLPLPVGHSDYREVSTQFCYVDKTMLIKEILDENSKVTLFTRPRRFGKSLNMDMLRVFFEKTQEDTSVYFMDKKIWRCGEKYQKHQGRYPVIFLTFKDAKYAAWEEMAAYLKYVFAIEFNRHPELLESDKCNEFERKYYYKVACGDASEIDLMQALSMLSGMLNKHHGQKVMILIDEYDTLIQQGYMQGYYERAVAFTRNLFSAGFKDNPHLEYGFLTGILRVAKESIFSGLNNLKVNSVLDKQYSEYFGFTRSEVWGLAKYYGVSEKYEEICEWYDGYRFGETDIFNPWSVIGYFNGACEPKLYWVSTGSNDIIGEILKEAADDIQKRLYDLLRGESVYTQIDMGVIYPEMKGNPASIYSFLLVAGYLKVADSVRLTDGKYACRVAIPNREIQSVYQKEILDKLTDIFPISVVMKIHESIYSHNAKGLQEELSKLLLQTVSCYDAANEGFYHGFLLGLCAMLDSQYYITSNRESGEGRFDIQLMPREKSLPGILIEVKAEKESDPESLKKLAKRALEQIESKKYDEDMQVQGVNLIFKYGVAFCGKRVEIATQ